MTCWLSQRNVNEECLVTLGTKTSLYFQRYSMQACFGKHVFGMINKKCLWVASWCVVDSGSLAVCVVRLNAVSLFLLFLLYACFSVQYDFMHFCCSQNYWNLCVIISSAAKTTVLVLTTCGKFLITRCFAWKVGNSL